VLQVVPGAAARRAARRHPGPRAAQRGGRRRGRPDRAPVPKGPRPRTSRRSPASAGSTSWSATAPRTCSWSPSARWPTAVDVADRLVAQGIGVTVVDPRWVKPVNPARRPRPPAPAGREHRGQRRDRRLRRRAAADLNAARRHTPFRLHGIPQRFLDHAKRGRILEQIGLTRRPSPSASSRTSPPCPRVAPVGRRSMPTAPSRGRTLTVLALLLGLAAPVSSGCSLLGDHEDAAPSPVVAPADVGRGADRDPRPAGRGRAQPRHPRPPRRTRGRRPRTAPPAARVRREPGPAAAGHVRLRAGPGPTWSGTGTTTWPSSGCAPS
jgi:hypothetical protein